MDKTMELLEKILDVKKKDLVSTKMVNGNFFSLADVEKICKKRYQKKTINPIAIVLL